MMKPFIILIVLHFFLCANEIHEKINWESWLPYLELVESRGNCSMVSYLGPKFGRGKRQVSEAALFHLRQIYPGEIYDKITPEGLMNDETNRIASLGYLNLLEREYFWKDSLALYKVLSAYGCGPSNTIRNGIDWRYVDLILRANSNWSP